MRFFLLSKRFWVTIGLVSLATGLPTAANAIFHESIINAFGGLTVGLLITLVGLGGYLLVVVLATIAGALSKVVEWGITASINIPVVPGRPGSIEIVNFGWNFARDFVNMLFLVILVFIGLATILRLQSYQAQKLLPLLLIIALLINFSGLLVGFVADIGNLFTNFFAQKITGFNLFSGSIEGASKKVGEQFKDLVNITKNSDKYFAGLIDFIPEIAIFAIFFFFLNIILFVIMLLFVARVAILWLLAILAPFAFAAYILPGTKKWWNFWWSNLITWSMLTIPVTFFLYLATRIAFDAQPPTTGNPGGGQITQVFNSANPSQNLQSMEGLSGILAGFLAPVTALLILGVGITLSMSIAPAAAQGIIGWGRKTGMGMSRAAGFAAGSGAWRRFETYGGGIGGWGQALRKRGELQAGATKTVIDKKTGAEVEKPALSRFERAPVIGGVARYTEQRLGRGLEQGGKEITMRRKMRDEAEFNRYMKEAEGQDSFDIIKMINDERMKLIGRNDNRITALLLALQNREDADDIHDAMFNKDAPTSLDPRALGEAIKTGQERGGPHTWRPLVKANFGDIMTNPRQFGFDANVDLVYDEKGNVTDVNIKEGSGKDAKRLQGYKASIGEKLEDGDFRKYKMAPSNYDVNTKAGQFFVNYAIQQRGSEFARQFLRRPKKEERMGLTRFIMGMDPEQLAAVDQEEVIMAVSSVGATAQGIVSPLSPAEAKATTNFLRKQKTPQGLSVQENEELQKNLKKWREGAPPAPKKEGGPEGEKEGLQTAQMESPDQKTVARPPSGEKQGLIVEEMESPEAQQPKKQKGKKT